MALEQEQQEAPVLAWCSTGAAAGAAAGALLRRLGKAFVGQAATGPQAAMDATQQHLQGMQQQAGSQHAAQRA
jgi:rhodanese-related sulfurtransferase